jgi:hypothetical protein
MPDKRDECGCHKGCTVLDHRCDVPCQWPACLTEVEAEALLAEIDEGLWGEGLGDVA